MNTKTQGDEGNDMMLTMIVDNHVSESEEIVDWEKCDEETMRDLDEKEGEKNN